MARMKLALGGWFDPDTNTTYDESGNPVGSSPESRQAPVMQTPNSGVPSTSSPGLSDPVADVSVVERIKRRYNAPAGQGGLRGIVTRANEIGNEIAVAPFKGIRNAWVGPAQVAQEKAVDAAPVSIPERTRGPGMNPALSFDGLEEAKRSGGVRGLNPGAYERFKAGQAATAEAETSVVSDTLSPDVLSEADEMNGAFRFTGPDGKVSYGRTRNEWDPNAGTLSGQEGQFRTVSSDDLARGLSLQGGNNRTAPVAGNAASAQSFTNRQSRESDLAASMFGIRTLGNVVAQQTPGSDHWEARKSYLSQYVKDSGNSLARRRESANELAAMGAMEARESGQRGAMDQQRLANEGIEGQARGAREAEIAANERRGRTQTDLEAYRNTGRIERDAQKAEERRKASEDRATLNKSRIDETRIGTTLSNAQKRAAAAQKALKDNPGDTEAQADLDEAKVLWDEATKKQKQAPAQRAFLENWGLDKDEGRQKAFFEALDGLGKSVTIDYAADGKDGKITIDGKASSLGKAIQDFNVQWAERNKKKK